MIEFPDPNKPVKEQEADVLLALTVLGEARGEKDAGKAAVANVVLNRMKKSGATVADTVLAPWQFSCWNMTDPNRDFLEDTVRKGAKNVALGTWSKCWVAAAEAMNRVKPDPSCGATHYCTLDLWAVDDSSRKRPRWHSKQEIASGRTVLTAKVGSHVFARAS